ncbi:MAG: DciA family protein [Candidatus Melainabacteria bacterium]|nr:DciA family protein [Candidatus Melainabacteria bacterium]
MDTDRLEDMKRAARAASRRKSPHFTGEPSSVGVLLPQVGRLLGLEDKARELALLALWPQVVDPPYRDSSRAVRVLVQPNGQKRLLVRVLDGVTAAQLGFCAERYCQQLNAYAPQTGFYLAGIDFKVSSRFVS